MSKKVKIIISTLVAALLVTLGTTATVMAQEEPAPPACQSGLLTRVASILGISQEELANALRQARQEMRDEAIDRALDKAVELGRITPEEAQEIKGWLEQKPAALGPRLSQRAPRPPSPPRGPLLAKTADILAIDPEELVSTFRQVQQEIRDEALNKILDRAVDKGLISQERADEIKEWWQQRPQDLNPQLFQRILNFISPRK